MDSKILRDLCESYGSIYEPEEELTEEQVWEKIENWVNSLIEEGYDLSDYTWEEMYEAYITEAPKGDLGYRVGRGLVGALRDLPAGLAGQVTGKDNPALQRQRQRGENLKTLITTGRMPGSNQGTAKASPTPKPQPPKPLVDKNGRNVFDGTTSRPSATPTASKPAGGGASLRPTASSGTGSKVSPTAALKVAPTQPAAPTGQTGDKAKDMATWAKANPKLAAAAAERARTRGTSATTNPLMQDMKSRMPAPSSPSPTTASTAFSKSTPTLAKSMSNSPDYSAAKVSPSANVIGKKEQKSLSSSFEWGSTSKLVDDIANLYQSVYEAKKVDQDKDGDNDFADVRIARLIASGVSKEEAIRRVKDKSYNEETELGEATRMRKELGKEGEIATRKELARRSNAYQRSGSVDKTIATAEREADRTTARNRDESEGDYKTRMQKRSQTLRGLAANRRKSVRSGEGLRGYAANVEGQDRELQSARGAARSAGTLTNKEKNQFGEELELWIQELINEGYDLSDYTWDEMYEIYEETEEERKRNDRRARVAELHASGRVMTSSKRASQKAAQRKQEKKEEMADRVLRSIQSSGSTRSSSTPMGSEAPEPKEAAPKANRKLSSSMKKDTLASKADELLRMLQIEDFELWVNELLSEGYELENWTDEELVELYVEILEEKYGTAAGRKKVAKMARAGKDIGKKGPGFDEMVKKLTPKYGKERATKIAAAQMYKTHA